MYIEPRTNIRLLKNVPVDEDYSHTLWFPNEQSQREYMIGLTKYNLTNYSYQRVGRGIARVGINTELLYDCNYMMFQNSAFGNKWFYAFITSVDYVNNDMSEVRFEIDVMQTWLFDVSLNQCMVEREHVVDDSIGKHTIDEKLEIGEYYISEQREHNQESAVAIYFAQSPSGSETSRGVGASVVGGVVSGAHVETYLTNDVGIQALNNTLYDIADQPEKIMMFIMIPKQMRTNEETGGISYGMKAFYDNFSVTRPTGFRYYDDNGNEYYYVPKNKKLLTYPYSVLVVDNYGDTVEHYKWEDFENPLKANFAVEGAPCPKPTMECYPIDYKGLRPNASYPNVAKQFSVPYDNFPMCPYNIDTFRAWASSTGAKQVLNTSIGVATTLLGGYHANQMSMIQNASPFANSMSINAGMIMNANALQNATNVVGSLANSIGNASINYNYAKVHGTTYGGTIGQGGLNWANGRIGFRTTQYVLRPEYAKIIDEYFNMYGYKVNTIKVPEISSRPHWNYVKTVNSTLNGSAPADDMRKIQSIYDGGITFWKNGNEVGNYTLDNRIQ